MLNQTNSFGYPESLMVSEPYNPSNVAEARSNELTLETEDNVDTAETELALYNVSINNSHLWPALFLLMTLLVQTEQCIAIAL